jgi:hypothetical protein
MASYNKKPYNIYSLIMDSQSKDLLIALRTIGQIPRGGKLNTIGRELSIYNGTWVEYLQTFRFWNDGEPETREYLKKFYNKVNQKCRCLIMIPRSLDTENIINSFIDAIRGSIYGLEHLRNSYRQHVTMVSHTGFILEDIINPLMEILYQYKGQKYNKLTFKDGLLTIDIPFKEEEEEEEKKEEISSPVLTDFRSVDPITTIDPTTDITFPTQSIQRMTD